MNLSKPLVLELQPRTAISEPGFWLPVASLCRREVVRFYRQPSRIIGALASPLVFWLLIGSGLGSSFRHPAGSDAMRYLEYFYPGTLLMILLFTAIFSSVSVIEDRREGFLQAVLVAPISRASIVLAKILGSTTLASAQGLLFLLLAPAAGIRPSGSGALLAVIMILPVAFALSGLGFLVAWPMESTQGFHSIMNLFLLPLWLLSGALFPAEGAVPALRWVIRANPLSYGLEGLRTGLYWEPHRAGDALPWFLLCLGVSIVFGAVSFGLAVAIAHRPGGGAR